MESKRNIINFSHFFRLNNKKRIMELKKIKTEKEYDTYLNLVDEMLDKRIKPNTPEGKNSQNTLLLIKQYEDEHYSIPFPSHTTKN